MIETKITPQRLIYNNEDFRIYACESEDESLERNNYNNISIKGVMPRLDLNIEYTAQLELDPKEGKYGASYNCISIYQDVPTSIDDQKAFLKCLLTELQVKEIYHVYPDHDILKMIQDNTFEYTKVKGLGKYTYDYIRNKIIENIEYKELLSRLGRYGINHSAIVQLTKKYESKELAIQKVEDNPYILTELNGIGFKKADAVARKMGFGFEHPFRIQAGIIFTIEQYQQEGHTYIELNTLLKNASDMLEIDVTLVSDEVNNTEGIIIEDNNISLVRTYNAEKYIAKKLREIHDKSEGLHFDPEEFIERMEEKHKNILVKGLSDQQKSFFHHLEKNPVNLLVGFAGCVDMDTEFFNGKQWKKISEYHEEDYVLQYNEDGTTNLIKPLKYHKIPEEQLTMIKTKSGSINQCLSDEHTVVYQTSKGHLAKLPFHEVKRRHENNKTGFNGRFLTTFKYSGKGINLKDNEIRLMVAVIADGHFPSSNNTCIIRLKKKRKVKRLISLLDNCNVEYSYKDSVDNYKVFTFKAPLKHKKYNYMWYKCSNDQMKIIADEVLHWDGSVKEKRICFSTTEKESADFIQFVFSSLGHRTTIHTFDRVGQYHKDLKYIRKSIEYNVTVCSKTKNKENLVSLICKDEDKKTEFKKFITKDGYKYCFTLPSGMWVMRRENRICVTGNCGKSYLQSLLIELLEELNISYALLSPTGKAAKVLSKYTSRTAQTIHKAIGYGEGKNADQLIEINQEFVIVDETSMVDVFIGSMLMNKLTHPNVKVLFLGDPFQLQSVSAGRVLHDMVESGVIPMTKLDIVFRQKEGGILDIMTRIRLGEKFIDDNFEGMLKFGENMVIHCVNQAYMVDGYRSYYDNYLSMYSPEDIMVLSPTKKGDLGTVAINKYIQSVVNPMDTFKVEYPFGEDKIFRVGDYVINTKNMYEVPDVNEHLIDIVNGDSGIITDIILDGEKTEKVIMNEFGEEETVLVDNRGIVVEMDDMTYKFGMNELVQLLHAWCITCHKSQGSSSKAVQIIADKSHKFQLSANLIYTAGTRAVDYCVLITQADTLNYAIRKVDNMRRNTRLQEFLKDIFNDK